MANVTNNLNFEKIEFSWKCKSKGCHKIYQHERSLINHINKNHTKSTRSKRSNRSNNEESFELNELVRNLLYFSSTQSNQTIFEFEDYDDLQIIELNQIKKPRIGDKYQISTNIEVCSHNSILDTTIYELVNDPLINEYKIKIYNQFINDNIINNEESHKTSFDEIYLYFIKWYKELFSDNKIPIKAELKEYFKFKYGKPCKDGYWTSIKLKNKNYINWGCTVCTFINNVHEYKCEMCDNETKRKSSRSKRKFLD